MRLITKDLHRAFPELDRFDEANAQAFVKRAIRRPLPLLVATMVMILIIASASLACILVSLPISTTVRSAVLATLIVAVPSIIIIPLASLLAMAVRDVILRLSIQTLIKRRGTCFKCGYSLLGMVVGPDLRITCPECQTITNTDAVLNELVADSRGRQTFQPSGAADTQLARQRLLRQLSRGVKVCGYVLLLLLAASAITFFGLHAWLTSMADQARADRTGSNAVDVRLRGVIITSSGSAPGTIDPAGWDALMHLASETTKAEARVKRPNVVGQTLQYLDLDVVRGGRPLRNMLTPMGNSTPADEDAEQLLRIKELVSDASAGPLHDAGLALLAAPLGVRPLPEPSEAPAAWGLWMPIPGLTLAARLQLARMEFALPASPHARYAATLQGEQATYLQSVAITLALARQLGAQWTLVDRSTASAIESDLLTSLQRHIESLPEPWLVELHNLLARQPEPAPVERVLEGDTIIMNDLLAWLFEDRLKAREMLRRGDDRVVYNGVTSRARTTPWQWLGSYAANRESLAAYRQAQLDKAIASKSTPFPKQLVLGRAIDLPPMATAMVRFRSDSIVLQDVSLRLRRQALGVMIAIERYQRRTGTYPPALSQLTFADGAFNTLDPISGTPFRYRLTNPDDPLWTTLTAGTNDHPKPYALWSVGPDGIDQLGTEAWLRNPRLTTIVSPADFIHMLYNESHDILLNDTSWGDNRQQLR